MVVQKALCTEPPKGGLKRKTKRPGRKCIRSLYERGEGVGDTGSELLSWVVLWPSGVSPMLTPCRKRHNSACVRCLLQIEIDFLRKGGESDSALSTKATFSVSFPKSL